MSFGFCVFHGVSKTVPTTSSEEYFGKYSFSNAVLDSRFLYSRPVVDVEPHAYVCLLEQRTGFRGKSNSSEVVFVFRGARLIMGGACRCLRLVLCHVDDGLV